MRPQETRTPCEGNPTMFDPDSAGYFALEAKEACHHCHRIVACREDAMEREGRAPAAGRAMIYGGLTPTERERLARQRAKEKDPEAYPRTLDPNNPDDPRHGSSNGYTNWGCRCEPCVTAGRARAAELRRIRIARAKHLESAS